MFGRGHKNRHEATSLINYTDFLRLRQEKEKIINNPFEENWKKAIVMEELLNLYGPQETAHPRTPIAYSRAKYNNSFGTRKFRDDDDQWDGNEDNQLNKYYKMIDGLNRWENYYQEKHIGKIVDQVQSRGKYYEHKQIYHSQIQQQSLGKLKRQRLTPANNCEQRLGKFQKLICRQSKKYPQKKKAIDQFEKIAAQKYGVHFSTIPEAEIDPKVQEFKKRDREIFHQFIGQSQRNSSIRPRSQQSSKPSRKAIDPSMIMSGGLKENVNWYQGRKQRVKKHYLRL